MKFVADTREKEGHCWLPPKHREMVRRALRYGDYSVDGLGPNGVPYSHRVCIERKSLRDWCGSIWGDWKRFSERLAEFRSLDLAAVVIEATEEDVRKAKYRPDARSTMRVGRSAIWSAKMDKLPPSEVLASTARVYAEFGTPVFLAGSPTRASAFAFAVLTHWVDRERARQ